MEIKADLDKFIIYAGSGHIIWVMCYSCMHRWSLHTKEYRVSNLNKSILDHKQYECDRRRKGHFFNKRSVPNDPPSLKDSWGEFKNETSEK